MTRFGVSVALLTPFDSSGAIDAGRLAAHAGEMLGRGADGVTLFGTTGENAAIAREERADGLAALKAAVPVDRITLGLCATAAADVAAQVAEGLAFGVTRFLLPPPFYFPQGDDEGLFAWHAQVLNQTPPEAGFILYHIPQITNVALSLSLVQRLKAAFPERILAIKDSAGDWPDTRALLESGALPVLIGDERSLHRGVPLGGAGAITGMANLYPERLKRIFETGEADAALSAEVERVISCPVITALKTLLAQAKKDPDWERIRPPLVPLDAAQCAVVLGASAPK